MHEYIKTDVETGLSYLKIGIMNAIHSVYTGKSPVIEFDRDIPFGLVKACCEAELSPNLKITMYLDKWTIEDDGHFIIITGYWTTGKTIIAYDDRRREN